MANATHPVVGREDDYAPAPLNLGLLEWIRAGWLLEYRTDKTRKAYGSDIAAWMRWWAEHGLDPLTAERAHVAAYALVLEGEGKSASTVARRLSAIAGFYRYAVDEGHVTHSPVERVRRPKVAEDSPTLGLDKDEAIALLDVAEAGGPHRFALVCLLLRCGLRISEACSLNAEDLDEQHGHRNHHRDPQGR